LAFKYIWKITPEMKAQIEEDKAKECLAEE
jgi:hypothetical protein